MQSNLPEPLTETVEGIMFSGSTPPVVTAVRRESAISLTVGAVCVELKTSWVSVMIDPRLEKIDECQIRFLNMSMLLLYNNFTA